jgi:predicted permease
MLQEIAKRQTTVEGIFASGVIPVKNLIISQRSVQKTISVRLATGGYFKLIGTLPQAGRFFTEADDDSLLPAVCVISDHLWEHYFGRQPGAIGQAVQINGFSVTVIGITRPEFIGERIGEPTDIWIPINYAGSLGFPSNLSASVIWLEPMARLRKDIPMARAASELNYLCSKFRDSSFQYRSVASYRLELLPGYQGLGTLHKRFSQPLWILMTIAGVVILIAFCNIAALLLGRNLARSHEIGVRLSIGASRLRIIRQLLMESSVLAILGGSLGLLLSMVISRQLIEIASAGERWGLTMSFDWRVFAFTLFALMLAVFIFGLTPALTATRCSLAAVLQGRSQAHSRDRSVRFIGKGLIIVQFSLSLSLIAVAGLMIRSFWNLTHQNLGFNAKNVVMAPIETDERNFMQLMDTEMQQAFYQYAKEVPGVQSAAVGAQLFGWIASSPGATIALPNRLIIKSEGVRLLSVSPLYIETLGTPLINGRSINDFDRKWDRKVAVINRTAERLMFGSENPLGKKFSLGNQFLSQAQIEVVGVVADFRVSSAGGEFEPVILVPLVQWPAGSPPNLVVRTSLAPIEVAERLEGAIRAIAPSMRIRDPKSLDDLVQRSVWREHLLAWISGCLGVLALLLSAVSVYGIVNSFTRQRAQEIGIRLSFAASPRQVLFGLVSEIVLLLFLGAVIGIAATLVFCRFLAAMLFGLQSNDPATLALAVILLLGVGMTAVYLPVYRATCMDPLASLRRE